jgi:mannose-6-phosphate isomerase-like protein (cupin superfamily)
MAAETNHTTSSHPRHVPLAAAAGLPPAPGALSALAFEHGTLALRLYAPRGHDPQQPHTRDELYLVVRGQGTFVNGADRHAFAAGDALFVPAGVAHRFEDFSEDLLVWVVFYGPEGGEAARAQA